MKIELELRPVDSMHQEPFFAINLYPETNKDITDMEWAMEVMSRQLGTIFRNGQGTAFHYRIIFQYNREEFEKRQNGLFRELSRSRTLLSKWMHRKKK